jgi:carbamoyl-phosphate synthase large subunit
MRETLYAHTTTVLTENESGFEAIDVQADFPIEEQLAAYRTEGMFDYVYAGDVAEGLLRQGASDATGVVNLGSGSARRVSELLQILAERFPGTRWREERSDLPFEAHGADLTRLAAITGWQPPTEVECGVQILVEHERAMVAPAGGELT